MAWFRVHLTEDEQQIVAAERESHPHSHVRRKMLVLDNARYQRNAAVQALAMQLKTRLLFLPSYSPNLNLIERLWKFIKRRAVCGRYHPGFQEFQAAIQETIADLATRHAEPLKSLMTLNFQRFEDVSLLAA